MALAVLGVYFDDSRMFDLISFARGSARNARTPIAAIPDDAAGNAEVCSFLESLLAIRITTQLS